MAKRQALGRGLSALLDNAEPMKLNTPPQLPPEVIGNVAGPVAMLSISQIEANPFQPRTKFNQEAKLQAYFVFCSILVPKIVQKLIKNQPKFA